MKFCMKCMSQYEDSFTICPMCGFKEGTLPTDNRCIEPGQIIADRYIMGMPLSIDPWVVRYIGWDALTNRKVVINEYLPTKYAAREVGKVSLTVVKSKPFYRYMSILLKKARLLAETHLPDNISAVHECFERNNTAYVITEYKEGKPLDEYIKEKKPVDYKAALRLFLPILRSLDKLHENGFISGGFSPGNFLVTDENELIFHDYITNIFYNIDDSSTERSPSEIDRYFPPERTAVSETIDLMPEHDVYSSAMILYEMLGAELPDPQKRLAQWEQKHKDMLKKPGAYGAKLEKSKENALINAAAVQLSDRTADMETFIKELTSDKEVVLKSKRNQKKFPLWAKITIPAVLVAGIGAAVLVPTLLGGQSKTVDTMIEGQTVVPSIVNRSFSEAEEELKKNSLLIEVEGKTVDDDKQANTVLSQNVDKGTIVSENTIVGVKISTPSGEFTMPNFLGIEVNSCTQVLDNIGMNYAVTEEFNPNISAGCVVSQSITPYSTVRANQRVDLVVSKGPEPKEASDEVQEPVETKAEDLVDKPYEEVVNDEPDAASASAPVQVVDRVYDDSKPEGTVLEQSPMAGETCPADEPVKVVVSTANKEVIVPDVVYMEQEAARQLLEYYGLKAELRSESSDTVAEGLVAAQTPAAGGQSTVGETIQVTVSSGKPKVKVPDVVGGTKEEAAGKLKDAGLAMSYTFESDSSKPEGQVLKQSIDPQTDVHMGTTIIICINSAKGTAAVPDIVGKDISEADQIVTEAGFNLIIYADEEHPYTEGRVAAQGPKPGLYAEKGSDMVVILTKDAVDKKPEDTEPPSIKLSDETVAIGVNEEFILEIDLSNVQDFASVEYDISDPSVVDVVHINKETLALTCRGLAPGSADIVISFGDLEQKCHVTVS